MFVKYKYNAGSTLSNVISDVEKLITGETNLLSLSSDCDTANSTIWSDVPAVWILHDASAGTNKRAYKALRSDTTNDVYTYITIDYNTSNAIIVSLYESWDETAHTGTNMVNPTTTFAQQRFSLTVGGNLYIGAGGTAVDNTDYLYLLGEYSGTYGNNGGNGYGVVVSNLARRMTWDTDVAGAPTCAITVPGRTGLATICYMPRYTTIANTSVTATALYWQTGIPTNSTSNVYVLSVQLRQETTNNYFFTKALGANLVNGFATGYMLPNIYVFYATANVTDLITGPDGKTYFIEGASSASGKLAVPRY